MTTRREAMMALPFLCAAFHARAQTPKAGRPRRIGILQLQDPSLTLELYRPFWIAMSKMGWILDENVVVERAHADGRAERLARLAEEPIRKRGRKDRIWPEAPVWERCRKLTLGIPAAGTSAAYGTVG